MNSNYSSKVRHKICILGRETEEGGGEWKRIELVELDRKVGITSYRVFLCDYFYVTLITLRRVYYLAFKRQDQVYMVEEWVWAMGTVSGQPGCRMANFVTLLNIDDDG